jgi:hypothetical protein
MSLLHYPNVIPIYMLLDCDLILVLSFVPFGVYRLFDVIEFLVKTMVACLRIYTQH